MSFATGFRSFVCRMVLASLLLTLMPVSVWAEALNETTKTADSPGGGLPSIQTPPDVSERTGLVAILVDEDTWNGSAAGEGFLGLGAARLAPKIQRYAEDIERSLPMTRTVIVPVRSSDDPARIRVLLEKLYFEGDDDLGELNELTGVVLVGFAPIPVVVTREGERALSMLPYTDFEDVGFVLDAATHDFIPNPEVSSTQPEVWHGIIRPPVRGDDGRVLLAQYFDKNHAYHNGDSDFADFDRELMLGDFSTEQHSLNDTTLERYTTWASLWEDLVYFRITNDLVQNVYNDLMGAVDPQAGFLGVDNDEDGAVDEDGFEDNNNDARLVHSAFLDSDDPDAAENLLGDTLIDEDPVGDANGDGCPGTCGQLSFKLNDDDLDGYPTAWEILYGFNPYDEKRPFEPAAKKANELYNAGLDPTAEDADEQAAAFLKQWVSDTMYGPNLDASCRDGGAAHPEWDDDGDFFCDEDGSSELINGCAFNDADCDGQVDEDGIGLNVEGEFDGLPDIQARNVFTQMVRTYSQLFQKPQGIWNRMARNTGRYDETDMKSAVALIESKDQLTMNYLREVNDAMESQLNDMVQDHLAEDLPLPAYMQIQGSIRLDDEDQDSSICSVGLAPNPDGDSCLQFVNHSYNRKDELQPRSFSMVPLDPLLGPPASKAVRLYGQELWDVENPGACTLYAGSAEDGGQVVELNKLYATTTNEERLSLDDVRDYENCVVDNLAYAADIPGMCAADIASKTTRDPLGAHKMDVSEAEAESLETGAPACFEFREMDRFGEYYDENHLFNKWLAGQIRRFRKSPDSARASAYTGFLEEVEDKRDSIGEGRAGNLTALPPRISYANLDILRLDDARRYTVRDLFLDLGKTEVDDESIDVYLGLQPDDEPLVVRNPRHGVGMSDVAEVSVNINKKYLKENSYVKALDVGLLTDSWNQAARIPSVYLHVEPTTDTLNAQSASMATPDLPIDAQRRISFMDSALAMHELTYPNVFDARTVGDVDAQLARLSQDMSTVSGGSRYQNGVLDFLDSVDTAQLADALAWKDMNLDEKHAYVLSHYLGGQEAWFNEARSGYELASLNMNGDPDEVFLEFNPDSLESASDSEWDDLKGLAAAAQAQSNDPLGDVQRADPTFGPVPIFEWFSDVSRWISELRDLGSGSSTMSCGNSDVTVQDYLSGFGKVSGGPQKDGSLDTASLALSTDQSLTLSPHGDLLTLTVRAQTENGTLNSADNNTRVSLAVVNGSDRVSIQGANELTLHEGMASFLVKSSELGAFQLQAESDTMTSNVLGGFVSDEHVVVTLLPMEQTVGDASVVRVLVELYDGDDRLVADDSQSRVELSLQGEGRLDARVVTLKNGRAETVFYPSTTAETVVITGALEDRSGQNGAGEIRLKPGEMHHLVIQTFTPVVPAGGSAVRAEIRLEDAYGNPMDASFYDVTLETTGGLTLYDVDDERPDLPGLQVGLKGGVRSIQVIPPTVATTSSLKAEVQQNPTFKAALTLRTLDGLNLEWIPVSTPAVAGDPSLQNLELKAVDANGAVVQSFAGEAFVAVSDPAFGQLESTRVIFVNGVAHVDFLSGTRSGTAVVTAQAEGMESGSVSIRIRPSDPVRLRLLPQSFGQRFPSGTRQVFEVQVLDAYDNIVDNDMSTQVHVEEQSPELLLDVGADLVTVKAGRADIPVTTQTGSGLVRLSAQSEDLAPGVWEGHLSNSVGPEFFSSMNPNFLIGNLSGGAFGRVSDDNSVGAWMTFGGRTQAMLARTLGDSQSVQRGMVFANGKTAITDDSLMLEQIAPSDGILPLRVDWRSFTDQRLIATSFYKMPQDWTLTYTNESDLHALELLEDGVGGYRLLMDGANVVRVDSSGQLRLFDPRFSVQMLPESPTLAFGLFMGAEWVGSVAFEAEWDQDVTLLSSHFEWDDFGSLSSGVYIWPRAETTGLWARALSGNSSESPSAWALLSTLPELDQGGEDLGLEGESKILTLISGGVFVGEAALDDPAIDQVVLGDPTVRLPLDNEVNALGYTEDLGRRVFRSDESILQVLASDVNGDEQSDLLVVHAKGGIDYVENSDSSARLKSRGEILHLENGIRAIDSGDVNSDGLDDLVISTERSCHANGSCLYWFENIGASYVAHELVSPDAESKVQELHAVDLNNDDHADVVMMDQNLKLWVLWNDDGDFSNAVMLKDYGLVTDSGADLAGDVIVAGLSGAENPTLRIEDRAYFGIDDPETAAALRVSKTMNDANGDRVEMGDRLDVTITLENTSGRTLNDVYIADSAYADGEFLSDTVVAAGGVPVDTTVPDRDFIAGPFSLPAGRSANIEYSVSVTHLPRFHVLLGQNFYDDYPSDDFTDIAIAPEGNSTGELKVFYSNGQRAVNGVSTVVYRERSYRASAEDATQNVSETLGDSDGDGIPDFVEAMGEYDSEKGFPVPAQGYDPLQELMGATDVNDDGYYSTDELNQDPEDSDRDGLLDRIDPFQTAGALILNPNMALETGLAALDSAIAPAMDQIESVIKQMTCGGGCLSIPGSIAFLTPGFYHVPGIGLPAGYDNGTPVFGLLGFSPFVCAGQACYAAQVMRLYLSPTTTLGLGLAVCLGNYPTGRCFAFNIPLLQLLGVCDAINDAMTGAMSKATSMVSSVTGSAGVLSVSMNAPSGGSSGLSSSAFESYQPPIVTESHIQVPGFPSIFTEWWKAQKYEFFKMLDLPDVRLIYPDPRSLASGFKANKGETVELNTGVMGLEKLLNAIHALPLVDIQPKPVTIYYPSITAEEVDELSAQWEAWLENMDQQWSAYEGQLKAYGDVGVNNDVQSKIEEWNSAIEGAQSDMQANLETLKSYKDIPEQIIDIKNLEVTYISDVLCYVTTILDFASESIAGNVLRVKAWIAWVAELKANIQEWQSLIKVSINFMDSCDKCTNQRFSSYQILLSLFAFIPEFPVIELPKLPDLTLDVSKIQMGVNVIWPDIRFVPQRIDLPELPALHLPTLPTAPNDLNVSLASPPDLSIPRLPNFDLQAHLPELPALSVPEIPLIPAPPEIPGLGDGLVLTLNIASSVLRIICLVRNGLIPTGELNLKTQIEQLTERASGSVLPFDIATKVEWPSFQYESVSEVQVNTTLNLVTDFNGLYSGVAQLENLSRDLTREVGGLIEGTLDTLMRSIEDGLNRPLQELQRGSDALEQQVDGTMDTVQDGIDSVPDVVPDLQSGILDVEALAQNPLVVRRLNDLRDSIENLNGEVEEWAATLPTDTTVTVTSRPLTLAEIRAHETFTPDAHFLASIQGTPLENLVHYRDHLVAELDTKQTETDYLASLPDSEFFAYLERESQEAHLADSPLSRYSLEDVWDFSFLPPSDDIVLSDLSTETAAVPEQDPEGLYVFSQELNTSAPLIRYDRENGRDHQVLMVDLDGDSDDDVVYTLGNELYFKVNTTRSARETYRVRGPNVKPLSDWELSGLTLSHAAASSNRPDRASFRFSSVSAAMGYDFMIYDSVDQASAHTDRNLKRLLLLQEREADRQRRVWVDDVSGHAQLWNARKRQWVNENAEITSPDSFALQAVTPSVIRIREGDRDETVDVPAYTHLDFSQSKDRTIRIESGELFWIQTEVVAGPQTLADGMEILKGEQILLDRPASTVTLSGTDGLSMTLDEQELFVWDSLTSRENPSAEIDLENGTYVLRGRALFAGGGHSALSQTFLLNPQICGDASPPLPVVDTGDSGDGRGMDLAIFASAPISASASLDRDSGIARAEWDLDANVDSDGDGRMDNDADRSGLDSTVGPYQAPGDYTVTLTLVDDAGNSATETIPVHVYVPELQLNEITSTAILGETLPDSPDLPYSIVRVRDGSTQVLFEGLRTQSDGSIEAPYEDSDLLELFNIEGVRLARFNPETLQLVPDLPTIDVVAEAAYGAWPLRLSLVDRVSGVRLGAVLIVNNANDIASSSKPLASVNVTAEARPLVYLLSKASVKRTPDRVALINEKGEEAVTLDSNAVLELHDDRYTLVHRSTNDLNEPLILEVHRGSDLLMEFWPGRPSAEPLIRRDDELELPSPPPLPGSDSAEVPDDYFADVDLDDPLLPDLLHFVDLDILEGVERNGKRYFLPEDSVNRAEFAKIILGTLCIVPRDSAFERPIVFNDVRDPSDWYYPYTKEAQLNGLITGYLGELNDDGLAPYKPNNTITRAEAVKIILEALELRGVVSLPSGSSSVWYEPYIKVALKLETPLLTPAEARDPMHELTRYELVELASRVLAVAPCTIQKAPVETNIQLDPGLYATAPACMSCPCSSTWDFEGDLRAGDSVFAILKNELFDIFAISNTLDVPPSRP